MSEYRITLSERQILLLERAIDAYTRIGAAQLRPILDIFNREIMQELSDRSNSTIEDFQADADLFKKKHFGIDGVLPVNEWSDDVKTLFDLQKCIQKSVATNRDSDRNNLGVWHNGPMEIGSEELAIVANNANVFDIIVINPEENNDEKVSDDK